MQLPPVSATSPGRKRPHRKVLVPIGLAVFLLLLAQVVVAAPPENVSFTASPSTAERGETVTFTASATDPDPGGSIASYHWNFGDGTSTTETDPETTHQYSSLGAKNVTLTVTDSAGETASAPPQTVTVVNAPPTAVIDCRPPQINQGEPVSCSSAGSNDPDGGITEYAWRVNSGPFVVGGPDFSPSNLAPGPNTITLRVKDQPGAEATASDQVSVNRPPMASIQLAILRPFAGQGPNRPLMAQPPIGAACTPGAERQGECVEFTPTTADADGTVATLEWDLDGDPATGADGFEFSTTELTLRPRFPYATPGNKTVRLRVTDNLGALSAPATVSFRVNRKPEIPSAVPGFIFVSPTPLINEPIRFSSQVTDPDGDIVKYEWDFDGIATTGPQGFEVNAGANPNATHTFTSSGLKAVRLRATDEGGISVIETRTVRVQTSRPTGGFTWAPSAPLPGQPVTFNSTANVSAAGKQILKREWDFNWNGANFTPDASGGSATHSFSTPGPKRVALRITEGPPGSGPDMQGELILFDTVNVNAAPRAAFTVAPASPFTGDVVTYSSTSVDPDGPLARHEWDLDGDGTYDDATGPVVSASYRRRGDYNVGLRITDSKGATATAVRRVTVRQRPLLLLRGVRIDYGGERRGSLTRLTKLRIRAPKGATVTVRCKGKSCPKVKTVKRKGKGRKKLRFKSFERWMRPGTKIIVTVTRTGYYGERTTIKMRKGRNPLRSEALCLAPGAKKAKRCPAP